ncbi:ABC-2 type transport system ATP-binding protein [Chitinophaga costaii]|uniref:ABC-2 type transport system ATP-binding protein n=1 Tax=Chitinophaga costaii TaxID=1335309 RepID=A0A1C4FN91_9BACT|nr:ABC transporter ATP-binding protein [Chitinophaga costaii]PUZ29948.1 ABC transporter ATP-binding protein [Chitinophaga costaii]SCC57001.1 ABC-2 type transport system ATP-binding protein [Chitinophaga costaii]
MDIQHQYVLQVADLQVHYGHFQAVKTVAFGVRSGEIFGLLGPNGAGKTSTLSAIEGLVRPNAGQITVAGYNIATHALQARAAMGVQLQATSFQAELTISEIVRLYGGIYGVTISTGYMQQLLEGIELAAAAGKRYGQLSGGQQQRVSLLIATIHQPQLVLLDEPTTGLDPQSRRHLWQRMEQIREQGNGVLLTTHSMEEAEAVCDRIAIIDHGSIIAIDTPEALIEKHRHDPAVVSVSRKGKITLEDVFIGLTGSAIRA